MEFENILRNSFSKRPSYFVINSTIAHWSFAVSKDVWNGSYLRYVF